MPDMLEEWAFTRGLFMGILVMQVGDDFLHFPCCLSISWVAGGYVIAAIFPGTQGLGILDPQPFR